MEEGCQKCLNLIDIDPEAKLIHSNNKSCNPFNVARFEDESKQVVNVIFIDLGPPFHLGKCGQHQISGIHQLPRNRSRLFFSESPCHEFVEPIAKHRIRVNTEFTLGPKTLYF